MISAIDPAISDNRLSANLSCPSCRADLEQGKDHLACFGCSWVVPRIGGRIPDFLGGNHLAAEQILDWPDEFATRASDELHAVQHGEDLDAGRMDELQAAALIDDGQRLSVLGSKLTYHLTEYRRQAAADGIKEVFLDKAGLGVDARVLDVGGGAGQTLRLLAPRRPAVRVVLDIDAENLALGCRLADDEGQEIEFIRGINEALPFRDGSFSHAICRGSISYMHQWRTLAEMVRVLEPGGFLYCRAEGAGYDRFRLANARTVRHYASFVYDYLLGTMLAMTGWQPKPGRFGGGRAYATHRRLACFLHQLRCEVVLTETGPLFRGQPGWIEVLARKADV